MTMSEWEFTYPWIAVTRNQVDVWGVGATLMTTSFSATIGLYNLHVIWAKEINSVPTDEQ